MIDIAIEIVGRRRLVARAADRDDSAGFDRYPSIADGAACNRKDPPRAEDLARAAERADGFGHHRHEGHHEHEEKTTPPFVFFLCVLSLLRALCVIGPWARAADKGLSPNQDFARSRSRFSAALRAA